MIALYAILFFCLLCALALMLLPLRHVASPSRRTFVVVVCIVFGIAAFGLYQWLGTPQIIPLLAERDVKLAELRASIIKNSEQVKNDSKNLAAWVELGQDFVETGQFSAAANAFRQAVLLSKGNPKLLLAYAKALILASDGTVDNDAKKALEMVLLQDKQNPEARYYMALRNLQDGKNKEAMSEMKSLYHSLPDDAPLKATINAQIGRN